MKTKSQHVIAQVIRWLLVLPTLVIVFFLGRYLVNFFLNEIISVSRTGAGSGVMQSVYSWLVITIGGFGGHGFITVFLATLVVPMKRLAVGVVLALIVSGLLIFVTASAWEATVDSKLQAFNAVLRVVSFVIGSLAGAMTAALQSPINPNPVNMQSNPSQGRNS